jgi:hypothetical protein
MRVPFNWRSAHLVVVSGTGVNFCGHAIINAGLYYFHIDGINDYPWYMSETGYKRYLKENDKKELARRFVPLSNPEGAQRKVEELSANRWRWLILPNNCVSYVEEVFKAGGSRINNLLNCPVTKWE